MFNLGGLHEENPCGLGFSAELRNKDAILKADYNCDFFHRYQTCQATDTSQQLLLDSMYVSVIDRKIFIQACVLALSIDFILLFSHGMRMMLVCCCAFCGTGWWGQEQAHRLSRGRQVGWEKGSKLGDWGQRHGQGLSLQQ